MALNVGQSNAQKAWAYMCLYWLIGWIVGFYSGHLFQLIHGVEQLHTIFDIWLTTSAAFEFAFAATYCCQAYINTRYSNFGRPSNLLGSLLFGVCNGTAETMLFLAIYDLGRIHLANYVGCSKRVSFLLGGVFYVIYNSLIHVFFWLRMVFPNHVRTDAPAFVTHGLPALCLVSIAWLTIYETQRDGVGVAIVCLLHFLVDTWMTMVIGLPSPMARSLLVSPRQEATKKKIT